MIYGLRSLLTRLFAGWEWDHLRSKRASVGIAICMVGGVDAVLGAERNPFVLAPGLILLTAGAAAIASIRASNS